MIAGLIDRRLELVAQLGQPFEPLLVRQILVERGFGPHRVSMAERIGDSAINIEENPANGIPEFAVPQPARRHSRELLLHCK